MSISLATRGRLAGRHSPIAAATVGFIYIRRYAPVDYVPSFVVPTQVPTIFGIYDKGGPTFVVPSAPLVPQPSVLLSGRPIVRGTDPSVDIYSRQRADVYNKSVDKFGGATADIYNKDDPELVDPDEDLN